MPLLKISEADLVPGQFGLAMSRIVALLLHPNDEPARATFIASYAVACTRNTATLIGSGATVSVQFDRADVFINDPFRLFDVATDPVVRGNSQNIDAPSFPGPVVAGNILLQAFSFQDDGVKDIGLQKCLDAQSANYRRRRSSIGSNAESLKKVWHEYRAISHLAAALIDCGSDPKRDNFLNDPFLFVDFIRLSNTWLKRGEVIKDRRSPSPILLPGEGWEIVISPCAPLARTRSEKI